MVRAASARNALEALYRNKNPLPEDAPEQTPTQLNLSEKTKKLPPTKEERGSNHLHVSPVSANTAQGESPGCHGRPPPLSAAVVPVFHSKTMYLALLSFSCAAGPQPAVQPSAFSCKS